MSLNHFLVWTHCSASVLILNEGAQMEEDQASNLPWKEVTDPTFAISSSSEDQRFENTQMQLKSGSTTPFQIGKRVSLAM